MFALSPSSLRRRPLASRPVLPRGAWLAAMLAVVVLASGCTSSSKVILPVEDQGEAVKRRTAQGIDFLVSEQESSVVVLSMREITSGYTKFYVTASKTGGDPASLRAEMIEVEGQSGDGGGKTQSAFEANEAPRKLKALTERTIAVTTQTAQASGSLLGGGDSRTEGQPAGTEQSRRAYSGAPANNASWSDLLLEPSMIAPGTKPASGLVVAPFSLSYDMLTIRIPVGEEMHTFRYALQAAE